MMLIGISAVLWRCCGHVFNVQVLAGLEMTADEFIDLCILLGCDYCDKVRTSGRAVAVRA